MDATITRDGLMEAARRRGGESADAYWDEFESAPGRETADDWAESAWEIAWHELRDLGATEGDHDACLTAWQSGFFGD